MDMNTLIQDLAATLARKVPVEKVILFGSHAQGVPREDSDIDLYVVTSDDFMPDSFASKHKIYRKVDDAIDAFHEQTPIDLIVHTLPMHRKFVELDSAFCRELMNEGRVLYERDH